MDTSSTPSVSPAPGLVRIALRRVRRLLWVALVVVGVLLGGLMTILAAANGEFATGLMVATVGVALLLGLRRLPVGPWTRLGAGYAALAGVLVFLAADEPAAKPAPAAEAIVQADARDRASFEVLMRYGKNHPLGRDFKFPTSPQMQAAPNRWKPQDPQWAAWLTANRAEIETGWARLEPVRAWWQELNAFARIADLTPPQMDAEMIAFLPFRTCFQHACAMASLQALDGDGEAAMATLLPILEVSRKLQPASRSLVRTMLAIATEKMGLETAAFILDTVTVSSAGRARLARALADGVAGESGARSVVLAERWWVYACLARIDLHPLVYEAELPRWVTRGLESFGPFLFNPQRTINLYEDMNAELVALAVRRDVPDIDAELRRYLARRQTPIKNLGGPAFLHRITPNYRKVLEAYWRSEDLRVTVQQRLQA
jgi:hypothetical protein